MAKRSNQPAAEAAPAGDAVTAAIDETRRNLQELQRKREENRAAYLAARDARDIATMRKLKVDFDALGAEIHALSEVLEADEEVLRDVQLVEMTQEREAFLRASVGAVASEFSTMREAYAETMRAIFTAAQFYRRVALAHERARQHVWSLRDRPLLEAYDTTLGWADVLPLDHLVRSILQASKGTGLTPVDHLKLPIADWLKRASSTEQVHLAELERGHANALYVLARILPETPPEAA